MSPPCVPQPASVAGLGEKWHSAPSKHGLLCAWGCSGQQPGSGLCWQETPRFHFSSSVGTGWGVGPDSAPSAPCPDHAADRSLRAEVKGLAGVRGPFHSLFSSLRHTGCQAPYQGAELLSGVLSSHDSPLLQVLHFRGCHSAGLPRYLPEGAAASLERVSLPQLCPRKLSKIAIPG